MPVLLMSSAGDKRLFGRSAITLQGGAWSSPSGEVGAKNISFSLAGGGRGSSSLVSKSLLEGAMGAEPNLPRTSCWGVAGDV